MLFRKFDKYTWQCKDIGLGVFTVHGGSVLSWQLTSKPKITPKYKSIFKNINDCDGSNWNRYKFWVHHDMEKTLWLSLKTANSFVWISTNKGKEWSIFLAFFVGTVFQENQIVNEGKTVLSGTEKSVSAKEMIECSNYHAVVTATTQGMEIRECLEKLQMQLLSDPATARVGIHPGTY